MGISEDLVETPIGDLRVTVALPKEVEDVRRLREDCARWMVERGVEQWRPGDFPRHWYETCVLEGWVYVGRLGEPVVASVTVVWEDPLVWPEARDPAGYVHMLMVDRGLAGQQVGRSLLGWAEDHIRRSGRPVARLDCPRSNRALRAYYERLGYRLVGFREFPELDGALETALYQKTLAD